MRSVFTLQRMLALARQRAGEQNPPKLLTARDVVNFATIEGARVNALERKTGTLTPGKEADIIMLRMDQINVMPVNNVYGAIVLAMDSSNVDTVLIGGKILKRDGKLVGVDIERVRREVHQSTRLSCRKGGLAEDAFRRLSARALNPHPVWDYSGTRLRILMSKGLSASGPEAICSTRE